MLIHVQNVATLTVHVICGKTNGEEGFGRSVSPLPRSTWGIGIKTLQPISTSSKMLFDLLSIRSACISVQTVAFNLSSSISVDDIEYYVCLEAMLHTKFTLQPDMEAEIK
jgi:hypothetical protein